jgi:hypothetical protein
MTFEDRQRDAMTDFNRSSYSIRDLLIAAHKRAQDEADIRKYELEDYERANGFINGREHLARVNNGVHRSKSNVQKAQIARLDASRAYREVTGRDAFAGAETYTRRNAEDIHD